MNFNLHCNTRDYRLHFQCFIESLVDEWFDQQRALEEL